MSFLDDDFEVCRVWGDDLQIFANLAPAAKQEIKAFMLDTFAASAEEGMSLRAFAEKFADNVEAL